MLIRFYIIMAVLAYVGLGIYSDYLYCLKKAKGTENDWWQYTTGMGAFWGIFGFLRLFKFLKREGGEE